MAWHTLVVNNRSDTCLNTLGLSLHSLPWLPPLSGWVFLAFLFLLTLLDPKNFSSGFSMTYFPHVCTYKKLMPALPPVSLLDAAVAAGLFYHQIVLANMFSQYCLPLLCKTAKLGCQRGGGEISSILKFYREGV